MKMEFLHMKMEDKTIQCKVVIRKEEYKLKTGEKCVLRKIVIKDKKGLKARQHKTL